MAFLVVAILQREAGDEPQWGVMAWQPQWGVMAWQLMKTVG